MHARLKSAAPGSGALAATTAASVLDGGIAPGAELEGLPAPRNAVGLCGPRDPLPADLRAVGAIQQDALFKDLIFLETIQTTHIVDDVDDVLII